MIDRLWLIGIGTGAPAHVTSEGMQALNDAAVILVPNKGAGKDDLAALRYRIIAASGSGAQVLDFAYPARDPALPYPERVNAWHDEIARRWQDTLQGVRVSGPVALLVWGDPSLYDSTIRIADRLRPRPGIRVVPGITAIQALAAAHATALNSINGAVHITTGRRLRDQGWPADADTLVVMLDGKAGFQHLDPTDTWIWWGAFLGMPEQILDHGPLGEVAARIVATRQQAREKHGWLMDTYMLRRGAGSTSPARRSL